MEKRIIILLFLLSGSMLGTALMKDTIDEKVNKLLVEVTSDVSSSMRMSSVKPSIPSSTSKPTSIPRPDSSNTSQMPVENVTGMNPVDSQPKKQQLQCGEKTLRDARVIAGGFARPGQAPFQVLLSLNEDGSDHYCSGVIIDNHTILTTARCVSDDQNGLLKEIWAIMGDISVSNSTTSRVTLKINSTRRHKDYKVKGGTHINDIAMLKLNTKLNFTIQNNINSICLPASGSTIPEDKYLYVTGWGYIDRDKKSDTLKFARVYPVSYKKCKEIFGSGINHSFCARNLYEGPCFNDWGAPLMRQRADHRVELVGLFSTLKRTKEDNCLMYPALFTKVVDYLKWINYAE